MRLVAAVLAALTRLVAGLVLGAVVGLVLAPLAVRAALDRVGDAAGPGCCTAAWSGPAPTWDGSMLPAVLTDAGGTVAAVDRARNAFDDLDALLQVP